MSNRGLPGLSVDSTDLDQLVKNFPAYESIIFEEMEVGIIESLAIFHSEVTTRTPVGATGQTRQSIDQTTRGLSPNLEGLVSTAILHGLPLERGRLPGRQPPTAPIELWVRRKLGIQGDEAESVAYAIARHIATKGTQGSHMFEQGFEAGKPAVESLWEREVIDRALTRIFEQQERDNRRPSNE